MTETQTQAGTREETETRTDTGIGIHVTAGSRAGITGITGTEAGNRTGRETDTMMTEIKIGTLP